MPISTWFLHQWHLLSATLEVESRPARIENTGELLQLVLSILVSLVPTPSRLVNRLKIVLSRPRHSGEKSIFINLCAAAQRPTLDSYSLHFQPLHVRPPSSRFVWNALIFDNFARYWWHFLLKCACLLHKTVDIKLKTWICCICLNATRTNLIVRNRKVQILIQT